VPIPTIQRVVERLTGAGLVTPERGRGLRVNDPANCSDLTLLPLWFDALEGQPERAAKMLGDFLALRRVVAGYLLTSAPDGVQGALPRLAPLAMELMSATTVHEVAKADQALTREVVQAGGNVVVTAIFHAIEHLMDQVPLVREAVYGDRDIHTAAIQGVLAAVALPPAEGAVTLVAALQAWDEVSVQRFRIAYGA
jgi:DNA-binding FadR family transcriptional regulator